MKHDSTISIEVEEGVYEPAEDSFLLLESIKIQEGMRVLEVGTGSGLIALHCARAGASVVATDINPAAVESARNNARQNGISLEVFNADLAEGVDGKFDVIIFNPPYLTAENTEVLEPDMVRNISGGKIGSEISIRFLDEVEGLLEDSGVIYLLTSSESEGPILDHAEKHYDIGMMACEHLFFEKLSVYRFKSNSR